jgi:hypothetical protein
MNQFSGCLLILVAAGCGVETGDRPASFAYITTAIFRPSCGTAACHSSQNQAAGYVLDEPAAAYPSLSGHIVPCSYGPGECYLNDPELLPSLYRLITEPPIGIDRMPVDSPLPDADIELIGQWLIAGAENN